MKEKSVTHIYVSKILKLGSYVSFLVLLLGLILIFAYPLLWGDQSPDLFRELRPFSLSQILSGVIKLYPPSIINLGLLILLLTPMLRLIVLVFSLLWEKDIKYTLITLGVLAILLFSLFVVSK